MCPRPTCVLARMRRMPLPVKTLNAVLPETTFPGMPAGSRISRKSRATGVETMMICAAKRLYLQKLFMTQLFLPKLSRPLQPISLFSNPQQCSGKQTAVFGVLRVAVMSGVAATVPAHTSGTMPRQYRIYSLPSNGVYGRQSLPKAKTNADIRVSVHLCPYAPLHTIITLPLMGNSAEL